MNKQKTVSSLLNGQQVVPVVVIENEDQARGLANALLQGGVNAIEITLRNDFGLRALQLVKQEFPQMLVLAGTVNSVQDMRDVIDAGVDGIVSPGITSEMLALAVASEVAYLPGVATASEILAAMSHGIFECKLFPASVVGGIAALKAFSGPFQGVRFCPTGGIGADDYRDYLALPNVMCVGGSWIAPNKLIAAQDWAAITRNCLALAAR